MNDSNWPTLEIHEPDQAECPTCGEAVMGEEFNQPFRDKPNMVEMWPGGPVMDVPGICREVEPDGPPIWTLQPCGHRIGKKVVYSPPPVERQGVEG
jgi:hypothetical protein